MMSTPHPSDAPGANVLNELLEARATVMNVQEAINQLLVPLLAISAPGSQHAGRARELSLGITNIQQGVLWFGQYRTELEEKASVMRRTLSAPTEEV
jgi:MarR-like DNA-binding transcriptional regulator SgrR of sgrS sRNA